MDAHHLPRTLLHALQAHADARPDALAFGWLTDAGAPTETLTYAQLTRRVSVIASHLRERVGPGERAVLLYGPGLEFAAAFLGCLAAGVIAVPAYPPRNKRHHPRLDAIVHDAEPKVVLVGDVGAAKVDEWRKALPFDLRRIDTLDLPSDSPVNADGWLPSADDLALLQYTSGSTSTPKGVMVTHGNIVHNSECLRRAFHLGAHSVGVCWLPSFHDMGLIDGVLQPLYTGFPAYLMAPSTFIQRPATWLEAITKYGGTHCGGPNFAYEASLVGVSDEQKAALDLRRWETAYNGAEPVRHETLDAFAKAFAPCGFRPKQFYPCYGLAESTLIVTGSQVHGDPIYFSADADALERHQVRPAASDDPHPRVLVGCGTPVDDLRVAIVDPDTRTRLSEGVGEIWVTGPSVAAGYWRRDDATRETFQARTTDGDGPFMRTGDLGFVHDGELFVTGRIKDLVIIRGRNHYPQDIEVTAGASHLSLARGQAACFSAEIDGDERLIVVQEVPRTQTRSLAADEVLAAMRAAIVDAHEVDPWDLVLVPALSLPKTSSGKLQRSESRRRYLADEFKVVARARAARSNVSVTTDTPIDRSRPGITAWLTHALAKTLQRDAADIDPHRPFAAMGVDSLAATRLAGALQEWIGRPVSATWVYDYPTIATLASHLAGDDVVVSTTARDASDEPIAIVGMGCRLPGAHGPSAFWELLRNGVEGVGPIPDGRWPADLYHPQPGRPGRHASPRGGFLDAVDTFDAAFFDISPNEADRMDPQQRVLLETTWEAFEHAGVPVASLAGSDTGVFVGISTSDYRALQFESIEWLDHHAGTGNALSIAANRVSYLFDLQGPSLAVDTACSSSLLAVHLACESVRRGDCALAVAGGVNLMVTPDLTVAFSQARMLSPDGRCKAFDAAADGYVRGEGCGMVVLKRLSDAERDGDTILAVVRASAVNQDGRTNGLTAPNGVSQQRVLRQALGRAGVDPHDVQFIEAHGTGTALGDPIELHAVRDVYARGRRAGAPLYVGSVKTNIGHLEAAAGVASLIKAALALQAREIPPHLHFERWNPEISLDGTQVEVPVSLTPWPVVDVPRAAVSAFGFGGTNVHVVLEAAPASAVSSRNDHRNSAVVVPLLLSARTPAALERVVEAQRDFLRANPATRASDIAFTMASRDRLQACAGVAGNDAASLAGALDAWLVKPSSAVVPLRQDARVAFFFTGQGSQYSGMAALLYESSPVARGVIDRLTARLIAGEGLDIRAWLLEGSDDGDRALAETQATQPALYIVQCALAALWQSWGVTPAAVIGHSVGEFAAAAAAGVFSDEDGLDLIAARGRLMQQRGRPGAMAAISADTDRARVLAAGLAVEFAAFNAPGQVVLAGDAASIDALLARCDASDVQATRLVTSHAFHTALIEDALDEFEAVARTIAYRVPSVPWVSNLTGDVITDAPSPDYWRRHARQPVRFEQGVRALETLGITAGIEIGPSPVLIALARRTVSGKRSWIASLDRRSGQRALADAVIAAHQAGLAIHARGVYPHGVRVDAPTYPFEPTKHWFTPPSPATPQRRATATTSQAAFYDVTWKAQPFSAPSSGPSVAELRTAVAAYEPALRASSHTERLPDALQALDSVALDWAHAGLATMAAGKRLPGGTTPEGDIETWPARLGVAPRHHRLAARLLRWLLSHQRVMRTDAGWTVLPAPDPNRAAARVVEDYPEIAAEAALLARCGPRLIDVLTGRIDPLHILFPGGDFSAAAAIYTDAPAARLLNGQAAAALEQYLHGRDRQDRVRILELGAGTGGLTTYLLPVLDRWGGDYEYVFTDLSPVFLEQAKEKFSAYHGVDYRLLDLESLEHEPRSTYDLAVAANAVHAVARLHPVLRGLHGVLRPAGQLWLLEGVTPQGWLDLTFGLTEGWWKAADGDGRSNYPLLSVDRWRRMLTDAGFDDTIELSTSSGVAPYALISASRPRHVRPPASTRWVLAGRPSRLREALHATLASESVVDVTLDHLGEALSAEYTNDTSRTHVVMCLDEERTDERHASQVEAEAVALSAMYLDALRTVVRHGNTRVSIVTRGARPHPQPDGAHGDRLSAASVLWGLGKTTALECPDHWGGLIDLDPAGNPLDEAGRLIEALSELSSSVAASAEDQQVWRGAVRWVPRLRPHAATTSGTGWPAPRGGVLVTGGTGAMGAQTVAGLARAGYRRFCLLSRRGHLTDEAAALLNAVRDLGATIELVNGDAASADDVAKAVRALESDGSVLQGILHAAGVPHAESLALSTREDLERVYRAKVQATLVLEALARDRAIDFFVVFSSMVALWGAKGQAVYAAGNHFLDDWAVIARRRGVPARGINWGPISGGGMVPASELTKLAALGVRALPLETVPRLLAQAMSVPSAQVAALDITWDVFRAHMEARGARPFVENLRPDAATLPRKGQVDAGDDVRDLVRREVAAVLGHSDPAVIDPERGFFDIGLDSLTIVQLKTRLEQALGLTLPPTLGLEYPSVEALAAHIRSLMASVTAAAAPRATVVRSTDEPIAIVGIGCRFPGGASNPDAYWSLMRDRVDAVRPFPAHRWKDIPPFSADPDQPGTIATRMGGFLDHIDRFDAEFFRLSAREAISLDPQHRLLLQVAWEALEDAGAVYPRSAGARVGVFAGVSASDYARRLTVPDAYYATGNALNAAPGRISYLFGFRGPSIAVDTACSSSLVAIRLACQSLRAGECDVALAGGVNLILSMETTQSLSRAKVLSPEGRCRAFDASADGMARAEGCGLIVLKPLSKAREDGDRIYAVIRAAGVNQDGASGGFTVPSRDAQEDLIRRTLAAAGVEPSSVDYVEAHGTGTPLGDPIEARALSAVFAQERPANRPLRIGSVKTNLGHTESASGVAGLIKTALALWREEIPPQLHFVTPSPHIDWAQMPLRVVTERTAWPSPLRAGISAAVTPRRAGVSSFGLSGTNAHVLLEEAPLDTRAAAPGRSESKNYVLVVSAATDAALDTRCRDLAEWLEGASDDIWLDTVYTLSARRAHLSQRWAVVCRTRREAVAALRARTPLASAAAASEEDRIARDYVNGAAIDWAGYWRGREGRVVSLPTYPFQPRSFWIDAPDRSSSVAPSVIATTQEVTPVMSHVDSIRTDIVRIVAALLQEPAASLDVHRPFLEMGADSIILTEAVKAVEQQFGVPVTIRQMFESLTTIEALVQYVAAKVPGTFQNSLPDVASFGAPGLQPRGHAGPEGPALQQVHATATPQTSHATAIASSDLRDLVTFQFQQATQALTQLAQQQLTAILGQHAVSVPSAVPTTAPAVALATEAASLPAVATSVAKVGADAKVATSSFWKQETPKRAELTPRQQAHLDALIERYAARTKGSKARESQDRPVFADMRTAIGFRLETKEISYPIVAERSWGARFRDIDGNEYVDMCMGFGVAFFGHQPPMVVDALAEQMREGLHVGPQSRHAAEVARLICRLTGMERVTFCNSGTEAVMTALRVARAATGRQKIVTFTGSYHGHSDATLALAGLPGKGEAGVPMAPGVSPAAAGDAIVLPYGVDRSLDVIEANAPSLAAVLVEPVQSRRPGLHPAEFLRKVREITRRHNVPLIFDEMITGFRVHPGGSQADFGVEADIATYGKMIGGGLPLGVVAARGSFLDRIDGGAWRYGDDSYPAVERTFYAGTFCKHPLAMAAARAILTELERQGPSLQAGLNARTREFVASINVVFEDEGVPLNLVHYGSLMRFNVAGNFSYLYQPLEMDVFCHSLIDRGVYIWEGRTLFLSTAHTDADLDTIRAAVRGAVRDMKAGGFFPGSGGSGGNDPLPLTESQRDLWVMSQLGDDGSLAYIESVSIDVDGALDAATLERAVTMLASRHEALRTSIGEDGQAQTIASKAVIDCRYVDLSTQTDPESALDLAQREEVARPFVLHQAPLWRVRAWVTGTRTVLALYAHHIIVDGWSMGVLLEELDALYAVLTFGRTPELQAAPSLREFLASRETRLASAPALAARDYWRRQLGDALPALDLPLDHVRPALKTFTATRQMRTVPAAVAQRLATLGTREGCSLFMTVLAGHVAFLHRLSGVTDIIVGVPVSGRPSPSDAGLVGFCTYMVPVRVRIEPDQPFTHLLKVVRTAVLDAFDHQEWPFGRTVADLEIAPDLSRTPVFTTTFNLDRPLAVTRFAGKAARLRAQPIDATAYDLSCNVVVDGDRLVVSWDANTDLWRPETLDRWLSHFETLLDSTASAPERPVRDVALLDDATKTRLVHEWNATDETLPPFETLHHWIDARLQEYGEREAVCCGAERVSGRQLDRRARVIEDELKARGVGVGDLVGVSMPRSIELLAAMIAILRTGAAYVPMDPAFPEARLARMAEHSGAAWIIGRHRSGAIQFRAGTSVTRGQRRDAVRTDPAYVIYTSASTGEPKGVVISHRAVVNLLQTMARRLSVGVHDRWLAVTTVSFDISVLELFLPLTCGASLVMATDRETGDGAALSSLLERESISFLQMTPSGWRLLLESGWTGRAALTMVCGGEALPPALAEQLVARGRALWNVYGPTETTIWSTAARVTTGEPVTIGRPLGNTQVYVVSTSGQLQPPGVPGELWIGGAGVAIGYHRDQAATDARFVANPFVSTAGHVYRTGDLARWTERGTLEFLGRLDHQVKVRGFRIELGEIESCVSRVPGVTASVAHVVTAASGESVLGVWYVATTEQAAEPVIRQALESQLPAYMVPAAIVRLNDLPRTPNGKVDRKALSLSATQAAVAAEPPATPLEQEIADVWKELLRVPSIGRHDDFLLLGGNSLLAARLATKVGGVSLRDVLEHRTVAGLAALVSSRRPASRVEIVL